MLSDTYFREFDVVTEIEDISTLQVIIDSLGWMDLLFLFFGIATAYRLANRGLVAASA